MEIRVYEPNLKLAGIIDSFKSLIWNRRYNDCGSFELYLPLTNDNIELFQNGRLVYKRGSNEAGVIEDINIQDSYDKKEVTIKGRFLTSYLDRRLIKETFSFSGSTEQAMYQIIDKCVSIPLLELDSVKGYDEQVSFQVTMKNLLSTEKNLAKSSNLGFCIEPIFLEQKLLFKVLKGVDRTFAQSNNPRVIFSDEYNNLNRAVYQYNNQLYKNVAIVGGEGEGTSRKYVTVGSGDGSELREIFVDAKDLRSDGLTESQYLDQLRQRGYESLVSNSIVESLDFDVLNNSSFVYLEDYDLGDIVSIRKWGIIQNKRITEIQEVYEGGGRTVGLTLGNPLKETVDWG